MLFQSGSRQEGSVLIDQPRRSETTRRFVLGVQGEKQCVRSDGIISYYKVMIY